MKRSPDWRESTRLQAVSRAQASSLKAARSRPAPQQVTHTVMRLQCASNQGGK
jgi:hypothetical protein